MSKGIDDEAARLLVGRLQIAVDNSVLVRRFECLGDLLGNGRGF